MHHLRHSLPIPGTAVLIVGFQSPGTLGRKLVDGAKSLMIFGEEVLVRASVHTMGGFSAHADQNGLLDWFGVMATIASAHDRNAWRRPRTNSV